MGLATALAFARHGASIVLAGRRADALEQAARLCSAAGAGGAMAVPTDVAEAVQVKALAQAAVDRFGNIDVWINMAGLGAFGPFETIPMEVQAQLVRVNLTGAMNGAHAALPHMLRQAGGRGVIINMASIGARIPLPFAAAYTASKFGLAGFTDALRHEMLARFRVQVCGVYPAFVDTPAPLHAANYSARALRPMPPVLDPADVAERIVGLVRRPRRALRIGAAHAVVPGFALMPETAGRLLGRLVLRFGFGSGPRVAATDGAVLAPVPAGVGLRSGWGATERHRTRGTTLGVAIAATTAVACLAHYAGRRRTVVQAAAPRFSRRW
jgi:short-subunit dehydrogenase